MDGTRFDAVVKGLAARRPRRHVLALFALLPTVVSLLADSARADDPVRRVQGRADQVRRKRRTAKQRGSQPGQRHDSPPPRRCHAPLVECFDQDSRCCAPDVWATQCKTWMTRRICPVCLDPDFPETACYMCMAFPPGFLLQDIFWPCCDQYATQGGTGAAAANCGCEKCQKECAGFTWCP